jgi:hypothetical protein
VLHLAITGSVPGVLGKFPYNWVEIMGEKFSHKLEVFLPWMLLNRNFLKENRYYPYAGWENFRAKIFPKLLLGQCSDRYKYTLIYILKITKYSF